MSKETLEKYIPKLLNNGETPKQLLARSRFILAKKRKDVPHNQAERARILFEEYPILLEAYNHALALRNIYEISDKNDGRIKVTKWIEKTKNINIKEFNSVTNAVEYNFDNIFKFFINRSTNASVESFNSKIKRFRANLRGVADVPFFLFRLMKLFA